MNLLITGGRSGRADFESYMDTWLAAFRARCPFEIIYLRRGTATGVDSQAGRWARGKPNIVDVPYDAPWDDDVLHHIAGKTRNQLMVDECEPGDLCLAFPGLRSTGTWDCVRRARRKRMEVVVVPLHWRPPLRLVSGGN